MAGGSSTNHIARWDGATWSALGTGIDSIVQCMTIYGGDLYVGGDFAKAGGNTANYIAKWNNSVGIKQTTANTVQISIWPNSAQNSFQVAVGNEQITGLKVIDMLGNEVMSSPCIPSVRGIKSFDISSLPNGVYFVQVKSAEGICTQKVIVQH